VPLAADALCTTGDVETLLLRPLTTDETPYVQDLVNKASDLMRNAVPSIDDRIARWAPGGADRTAVSPGTAATVVAGVVKRYLRNPDGVASQSSGPFSVSYALRGDNTGPRGVLEITSDDIRTLFPNRKRPRAGTIRTRPALAPRPVGRYGPLPGAAQLVDAVIDWADQLPVDGGEIVIASMPGPDGPS
jgi:hypothetical protein